MNDLFFYASKIIWAMLSPSNFIILLLVLGTIALLFQGYRWARRFLVVGSLLGLTVMVYPVGDYLIEPLESRFSKPQQLPTGVDGIIILGGGEDLKASISWQTPELGSGADRYVAAAHLARNYPIIPVIFSGGSGSILLQGTSREGDFARQTLRMVGVNTRRIIIESESRNTYENFVNLKSVLPKPNGKYILITSAFHMPRSVGIARKLDINVVPYPVDYKSNSSELRQFKLDFNGHIDSLETGWREWIGLTAYYLSEKTNAWFPAPQSK